MRIAHASGRHTSGQVVHRLIGRDRHSDIQQRHVDMLAPAGRCALMHRRQNRRRGVDPGKDIRDRDAGLSAAARPVHR